MSDGWTSRIRSGGIGIAFLAGLLFAGLFHLPLVSPISGPAGPDPEYAAGQPGHPGPEPRREPRRSPT